MSATIFYSHFYDYLAQQGIIKESDPEGSIRWPEKYMEMIQADANNPRINAPDDFCSRPGGREFCRFIHRDEAICKELRKCKYAI